MEQRGTDVTITDLLEAMAATLSKLVQGLLAEGGYSYMSALFGPIGFMRHAP